MTLPPIATIHLFADERDALLALLRDLSPKEWYPPTVCNGWNVHDVALHLLGADMNLLSGTRDHFTGSPAAHPPSELGNWETLIAFINERNAIWIDATRRVSPPLLMELLEFTGERVVSWLPALDTDTIGNPVDWVGPERAPVWMHIAREYSERWVHQQHIRDATSRPGFTEPEWLHPVLAAFARGLPHAIRDHHAPDGSIAQLEITGPAGGFWFVQHRNGAWGFLSTVPDRVDTVVSLDEDTAWRGFTRGIETDEVRNRATVEGDQELGRKILAMISINA